MGGGGPRGGQEESNEELVREVRKLRDEVHDLRRSVDRIADALEE
jgi:cell division protein FtsB